MKGAPQSECSKIGIKEKLNYKKTGDTMKKDSSNPFVGIAGTIGGISVAIVAIFMIFAPSQGAYAVPIVIALAIMGAILGHQAMKKK